ncbi:hypothetical protein BDA99DRAFT_554009 [Phascolomyces articulosus]|uniref:Uncharacterized protein n=1 Tax=Phascolomyces articulosus TaxID=60185 RepID=A0AAD5KBQ3_9FUNG|nr:hypothetical protein BDA99DRAFT_554009 [Phascolomyces articulosus]
MAMWWPSAGQMDDGRIVIEASSGGYEENQDHTKDDALNHQHSSHKARANIVGFVQV